MTIPDEADNIVFLINKSVIEQQNLDFMISGLNKLLKDESTIRKFKNKVTVGFDGYDGDPREVYEIDEVRGYIQALTLRFPYWFYFCNKNDSSLWIILMAHCRFRKFGSAVKVLNEDARKTSDILLTSLINFYEENNLTKEDFVSLTRGICHYFESRMRPSL